MAQVLAYSTGAIRELYLEKRKLLWRKRRWEDILEQTVSVVRPMRI